jgi:hypothetical protein
MGRRRRRRRRRSKKERRLEARMLEKDSPKTKQDEEQRAMQKCVSKQIEKAGKP